MQNTVNPALTPALLRELAEAKPPCITVALQTGGNPQARLRDAIRDVEAKFHEVAMPVTKEALEPFHDLSLKLNDVTAPGGIIVLSSPDFHYRFTSNDLVQEIVSVGDVFHLRSLLPLLNHQTGFYILALSQNHPRLLHCTESTSDEVALPPGTPASFNDSRQTRQPDHDLEGRSSGGPSVGSIKGVQFGTSSDDDQKNQYLANFFLMIDRGVNAALKDTGASLVVVGVDHELALYRTLNTYPHTVEPGVRGAPDGLKGGEMHRRALELLASRPPQRVQKALDGFEKHVGTGHASSHAQEIVRAAFEGRVSQMFVQESAEYRGIFNERKREVKRHEDALEPLRDLLNDIVVQTLRHGGEAIELPARDMPHGVPFCAVFRYVAPELQTATAGIANPVV